MNEKIGEDYYLLSESENSLWKWCVLSAKNENFYKVFANNFKQKGSLFMDELE